MGLSETFNALSDPTRREIVRLLRGGELTAGEIAARFPLAKSTLSAHFNVLRHAGLIVSERHATKIVYSLNASAIEETLSTVFDLLKVRRANNHDRSQLSPSPRRNGAHQTAVKGAS